MYKVEVINSGDSAFKVSAEGYEFSIDTKGKAASPPAVLLASLGSCVGVYIRKYCEGSNIQLKEFTVKVEAEFSKEAPVCFKDIRVAIDLKGSGLDERRKASLLSFIKNCPVHNTLKADPRIEVTIT